MTALHVTNRSQFRMVSNMKAAPNSQGTLFQGGNAQRYPRGYTPDRQIEVLANLHPKTYAALSGDAKTRAIVDTVKRSTVPAEGIRNVHFTPAGNMGRQRGMSNGLQIGGMYQGSYKFSEDYNHKILTGTVQVASGEENTSTPIHELGHHQSRLLERKSSEYNTPARKGADEGFAETFAERNWRDRRGRPDANFSTTPHKWTSNMGNAAAGTFAKHFQKEREGTPSLERTLAVQRAGETKGRNQQDTLFDAPNAVHSAIDNLLASDRRAVQNRLRGRLGKEPI